MTRPPEFWRLLNLPCGGMSRLASESLDRPPTRLEAVALRSHLVYCSACRRYFRQIRVVSDAMRRLVPRLESSDPLPGPSLPDDVRERIKQAIRDD